MDTRIKIQEIIPRVSCGADIIKSDQTIIVAEREIDISDEEILKIGDRYKELQKVYLEITADMRGGE